MWTGSGLLLTDLEINNIINSDNRQQLNWMGLIWLSTCLFNIRLVLWLVNSVSDCLQLTSISET